MGNLLDRLVPAIFAIMLIAVGCAAPILRQEPITAPLEGQIEVTAYRVADAASDRMAEIARGATVSLIRTDNGQTVASSVTDDKGGFILNFGAAFLPTTDQPYLLEAVKGLKLSDSGDPNAVGATAARLRTLIVWKDGWTSFRNKTPGPLTISIGTTALSLLVRAGALDAAAQRLLIGSLASGDAFTVPAGFPNAQQVGQVFDFTWSNVRDALGAGQDPVAAVALPQLTETGAQPGRIGPPLAVTRANPTSLEPGGTITFYGRGFSKVAVENVLWVRTLNLEFDRPYSATAVAPDGTWARFDAPSNTLPVPGPMTRYEIEVRSPTGLGQTVLEVPWSIARPARRVGQFAILAGNLNAGGSWREGNTQNAKFWGPSDVRVDAAGNVYVCEHWFGNRIRMIANKTGTYWGQHVKAGQVATVVGDGYGSNLPRASRFNGENLPVLQARLSLPWSIWLDPAGNLMITDYDAGALFRVAAVADANLYGTQVLANKLTSLNIPRGAWGARGMVTDVQGNLYYFDWGAAVIRFIPKAAGTYWGQAMNANQAYDLANSGSAQTIAPDGNGNLLVTRGCAVHMLAQTAGTYWGTNVPAKVLTPIVGIESACTFGSPDGGMANTTNIGQAYGAQVDTLGNLYFCDNYGRRIRVVPKADGSVPFAVKGAGDIVVPAGAALRGRVYRVLGNGAAGDGTMGEKAYDAMIRDPYNFHIDAEGGLYLAEFGNNRIVYVATR